MIIIYAIATLSLLFLYTKNQKTRFTVLFCYLIVLTLITIFEIYSVFKNFNTTSLSSVELKPIDELPKAPSISIINILFGISSKQICIALWLALLSFKSFGTFRFETFLMKDKHKEKKVTKRLKNKDKLLEILNNATDTDDKILMGIDAYTGELVYIDIDFTNLFHTAVSRAGKTVTLFNLIDNAYNNKRATVVITGKASKQDTALNVILSKPKYNDYIIFDITEPKKNKYIYDPFKNYTDLEIIDMIITLGNWTEPHYQELFQRYFAVILEILKEIEIKITIENIANNMRISVLKDNIIDYFKSNNIKDKIKKDNLNFKINTIKIYEEEAMKSLPRFENLINGYARDLFIDNTKESFNILDIYNQNKQVIFVLDGLGLKTFSKTFGNLLLIEETSAIQNTTNNDIKYSIYDEYAVYLSEILVDIANKTLEYNHHSYFSTQSPSDNSLVDNILLPRLVGNCNQFIQQRLNDPDDANYIASLIGTRDTLKLTAQYDNSTDGSEKGSARETEAFIVHPNQIKKYKKGTGAFVDKDYDTVRELVYFKYRGQNEL